MPSMTRMVSLVGIFSFALTVALSAHDWPRHPVEPPKPPSGDPWLFGGAKLERPDPAVDEDASGFVHLAQHGERWALHVHVRDLAPGATYDVTAALGDKSESIGMITTRPEEPPTPPRLYAAKLSGAKETPPVETDGRGIGIFVLNADLTKLSYHVIVWRLSGPATAAHIHKGAVGEKGDVVFPLDEKTLEGSVDITAEQVADLAAGNYYVNVHTEKNPDGEIRGQIKPLLPRFPPKPHPGSGALRLDSKRGDKLPLGATTIADLKGVVISVLDGDKKVVLSGTVAEIRSHGGDDAGGDGGGAAFGAEEDPPTDDTAYFGMDEKHDASFIRGDVDDNGVVDLTDAVVLLHHLFLGGPGPYCQDAADTNDDGRIEMSDAIYTLISLFQASEPMLAPFPDAGFDHTPDQLFCEES